ncbi:hypothetical protein ACFLZ8_05145 [Planctomycetota bacterium]
MISEPFKITKPAIYFLILKQMLKPSETRKFKLVETTAGNTPQKQYAARGYIVLVTTGNINDIKDVQKSFFSTSIFSFPP